jgi:thioredoxin 1
MGVELAVTAENFESEVLRSEVPVLLDFWAEWCKPCRGVGDSVAELGKAYDGRVKVAYVNADAEYELAQRFGVISVPTLVVCNEGAEYRKKVGAVPKHDIETLFKDLV